jgi:hypothetical protein
MRANRARFDEQFVRIKPFPLGRIVFTMNLVAIELARSNSFDKCLPGTVDFLFYPYDIRRVPR